MNDLTKEIRYLDWMGEDERVFRTIKLPDVIKKIQEKYKLLGYFNTGVGSVVGLFEKGETKYVLKFNVDNRFLEKEFFTLKLLRSKSINCIQPIELFEIEDIKVLVLEFIEEPVTAYMDHDQIDLEKVAVNIATHLSKLHSIKLDGFGEMELKGNRLVGKYQNYKELISSVKFKGTILEKYKDLYSSLDKGKIISYQEDIIKNGRAVHTDLALHNTFGKDATKFFDIDIESDSPLLDLSISVIWAYFYGKEYVENLIKEYSLRVDYFDEQVFREYLKFAVLSKLNWWDRRVGTDKKVIRWIEKAERLVEEMGLTSN